AGTPDFAVPSLRCLITSHHDIIAVYTQPDRPFGRGRKLQASPIKQLALAHQLTVYQPTFLQSSEIAQAWTLWQPDVLIVVAYGLLIPQPLLAVPKQGAVNVHASLLPRWRGAAPIQRAIEAGDTETGITLMQMDAGLDTGQILYQARYHIPQYATTQTVMQ